MELRTQRLFLREFRASDFEAVCDYEMQPQTHYYEREVPGEDAIREMLQNIQSWARENPRTRYRFAVTIRPGDRVIGLIALSYQSSDIREWEIGWTIHYQHWGQGYASEAAEAVLDFAFKEAGAHRVVAFCNVLNAASIRVMEKIGMRQDGRLRETRWWNGGWSDEFVYAILERDWAERRP